MKRHLTFLTSVLLLFVLFTVVSCSEAANLKKGIIGKWFQVAGTGFESYEFLKDGTVIWVEGGKSMAGNYKFLDDNRIKVELGAFGTNVFEVSIDNQGQLLLTDPGGNVKGFITEAGLKEEFTFSDLTVLDKQTKLMWTRDANIAGKAMAWDDAVKFIEGLNKQNYAGYSDWRLPMDMYLLIYVNIGIKRGYTGIWFFNKIGFKNVQKFYWSTNNVSNARSGIDMISGKGLLINDTDRFYVWPVRDGQ